MEKLQHIIEDRLNFSDMDTDDGGSFRCFQIAKDYNTEEGMYVKICSWDEDKNHFEFEKFINRKIRITIETID